MTIKGIVIAAAITMAVLHVPWWLNCIILLGIYLFWAYHHPWIACWKCGGTGNSGLSTARRKGPCMRCDGKGKLTTLGFRFMNSIIGRKKEKSR